MLHWSEFATWLECPEKWRLKFIKGLSEVPSAKMEEGAEISAALDARLLDLDGWKPGRSVVLKEYHGRYKGQDKALAPWQIQVKIERECFAGTLDAQAASGLVRETKLVGDRPWLHHYEHQLLWYCWLAGTTQGQLDLIYKPGWIRTGWEFERRPYTFTPKGVNRVREEARRFLAQRLLTQAAPDEPLERRSQACNSCGFTKLCWEEDSDGRQEE